MFIDKNVFVTCDIYTYLYTKISLLVCTNYMALSERTIPCPNFTGQRHLDKIMIIKRSDHESLTNNNSPRDQYYSITLVILIPDFTNNGKHTPIITSGIL